MPSIFVIAFYSALSGLYILFNCVPRALPWAVLCHPFWGDGHCPLGAIDLILLKLLELKRIETNGNDSWQRFKDRINSMPVTVVD
jgi:hypothetical protein